MNVYRKEGYTGLKPQELCPAGHMGEPCPTSPFGFKRHQGHSARSPVAHLDEPIYPAQATLPQESDQLRLHRHSALNATKATAPRAQLLTLTSPSTLHRPHCLRSQTSSSYTATQMDGLLPTIHTDEPFPQLRWTGSYLQFILTSSSPNSDGRTPTIHIDELFPQLKWTSSYYSH